MEINNEAEKKIYDLILTEMQEILDTYDDEVYSYDTDAFYLDAIENACKKIVALQIEKQILIRKISSLSRLN